MYPFYPALCPFLFSPLFNEFDLFAYMGLLKSFLSLGFILKFIILVVQSLIHVQLFTTPWTAERQASLSFTIPWSLLKLMSIESVMHPTISSSVIPFSSCLQTFPASGSFQ